MAQPHWEIAVTEPMYLQIYHHLLGEIQQGRLKQGDRVPSEKELAEAFEVSRITSKKALEMLAQANLIERERGRGSFVSQADAQPSSVTTRQAYMIGIIMSDFSDVYGSEMLKALAQHTTERKVSLVIKVTLGRGDLEEQAIEQLIQQGADGIIIMPVHGEFYNAELLRMVLEEYPLVLIDRYLKGIPAYTVHTDNIAAAQELTDHLLQNAHRHIAFISPPFKNTSTIEERLQGYKNALASGGVVFDSQICFSQLTSTLPPAFEPEKTQRDLESLRAHFERYPQISAVVASEYNAALLAQEALRQMGRRNAVKIACFDYPHHALRAPLFTYIRQDETAMARLAIDILLKRLAKETVALHHIVPHTLVEVEQS
jgi:GntR family transcriptional regulator, arabinose operon transcriptional repressor